MTGRAVKVEAAPVGVYRRGPRGRRRIRRLVGEGYRREDDERPVRLSFKLFADETRVTHRFARRREALTGKQRGSTTSEVNAGSNGCKEGPVGRRAATKDNTKFTGLFTRAFASDFLLRLFVLDRFFLLARRDQDTHESILY